MGNLGEGWWQADVPDTGEDSLGDTNEKLPFHAILYRQRRFAVGNFAGRP